MAQGTDAAEPSPSRVAPGGPPPAAPAPRPTIRTVAERAGVSKSLVSLVLRDSPQVSPARRQAVLDAMAELRYRPAAAARALSESRSRAVGVLVDDLRNPWYLGALDGINAALGAAGLQMLLADQRLDRRSGETFVRTMLETRVEGLVLVGSLLHATQIDEAAALVPTVVVGTRDLDLSAVVTVSADDDLGVALAVEHLVALGHRRIGAVTVPATAVGRIRAEAYRRTMAAHGLAYAVATAADEPTEDGGYRASIRLLTAADRPTALVCYNDLTALGALSAARDLGLDVPADLSVVGYDNTQLARLRYVALTSVDNASERVGHRAASVLVERIGLPWSQAALELVAPALVVRGTSGPAPAA